MKQTNDINLEIKQLCDWVLELNKDIEHNPVLIYTRMKLCRNLLDKIIAQLDNELKIESKNTVNSLIAMLDDKIQADFIKIDMRKK